jgi:hypothetical protein
MTQDIRLSAIVPVTEGRYDDVAPVFEEYRGALAATGIPFEMIYVLDGELPTVREALRGLKEAGAPLTILQMAKPYGEALAIMVGFEHARGEVIATLPAFRQVESRQISTLIAALQDTDMVVARRWPRTDPASNRIQARIFNWLLGWVSDVAVRDAGCNVRVFKRRVLEEVHLYGNQHRFLPLLAHQRGFKIQEVDAPQAQADAFRRVYSPGTYLGYLLDFLTVFFLVKFTKRPLRFFGILGSSVFAVGFLITLYLVAERLLGGVALANRPALILSSLLIILGIQVLAIGLIGEIIIFTHARELKEYTIAEIVN